MKKLDRPVLDIVRGIASSCAWLCAVPFIWLAVMLNEGWKGRVKLNELADVARRDKENVGEEI